MSKSLKKHTKKIPWFLLFNYPKKLKAYENQKEKNRQAENPDERTELNAYRSPSPMNELCDYICTWERKNLLWDNSSFDARPLILNQKLSLDDKALLRKIRHLINEYAGKLKDLLEKKREEGGEADYGETDLLLQSYQEKLSCLLPDNEELLANYVIAASYSNLSVSKSLAWSGYGDWLLKNLKENSKDARHFQITQVQIPTDDSYEYLGKYYEMREE